MTILPQPYKTVASQTLTHTSIASHHENTKRAMLRTLMQKITSETKVRNHERATRSSAKVNVKHSSACLEQTGNKIRKSVTVKTNPATQSSVSSVRNRTMKTAKELNILQSIDTGKVTHQAVQASLLTRKSITNKTGTSTEATSLRIHQNISLLTLHYTYAGRQSIKPTEHNEGKSTILQRVSPAFKSYTAMSSLVRNTENSLNKTTKTKLMTTAKSKTVSPKKWSRRPKCSKSNAPAVAFAIHLWLIHCVIIDLLK